MDRIAERVGHADDKPVPMLPIRFEAEIARIKHIRLRNSEIRKMGVTCPNVTASVMAPPMPYGLAVWLGKIQFIAFAEPWKTG